MQKQNSMSHRNKIIAAVILIVVSLLIYFVLPEAPTIAEADASGQGTDTPFTSTDPELAGLTLERETDKAEIFRRAFWRNPSPEDTIQRAERRQWSGESGVQRWDWFIGVDASESLSTYLLEQNPFQLTATAEPQTFSEVPAWFPVTSAGFTIHQSLSGEMTILFNSDTRQLYAKSNGHGFRAGAPEAQPSSIPQQDQNIGRLPNEAPPIPSDTSESSVDSNL
jgi:hypothetical protein